MAMMIYTRYGTYTSAHLCLYYAYCFFIVMVYNIAHNGYSTRLIRDLYKCTCLCVKHVYYSAKILIKDNVKKCKIIIPRLE